jgi:hypothetical protein
LEAYQFLGQRKNAAGLKQIRAALSFPAASEAYSFLGEEKNAASRKQIALSFAYRHWDLK